MTDIREFIRARLDEDERVAQRVKASRHGALFVFAQDDTEPLVDQITGDRLLAEVEANRRILDLAESAAKREAMKVGYDAVARLDKALAKVTAPELQRVLCLLALPHAGHPDFDPSWEVT